MAITHCLRHQNNDATGYCSQCHTPYCGDCAVESLDETFCSKDCALKFAEFHSRCRPDRKPSFFVRLLKLAVAAAVVAVVVFLVWKWLGSTPTGRRLTHRAQTLINRTVPQPRPSR